MTREELLTSKEYWITKIQLDLFDAIKKYLKKHNLNKTKLSEELGFSKSYITQVLNGDFDHKISKFVELALACNKAPILHFRI